MANENLPMIDKVETGKNIKRLMRKNNIAITQLQLTLGMSSATNIYKWCRGELTPSSDRLVHLSRLFKCTIEDILIVKED